MGCLTQLFCKCDLLIVSKMSAFTFKMYFLKTIWLFFCPLHRLHGAWILSVLPSFPQLFLRLQKMFVPMLGVGPICQNVDHCGRLSPWGHLCITCINILNAQHILYPCLTYAELRAVFPLSCQHHHLPACSDEGQEGPGGRGRQSAGDSPPT